MEITARPSKVAAGTGTLKPTEIDLIDRRASRKIRTRSLLRLALILVLLFVVLLAVRSSVLRMYRMGGPSMAPTLCVGDGIWINLAAYDLLFPFTDRVVITTGDPVPGEIVMCSVPGGRQGLVKRVLAVGGDKVESIDGRLAVNGKALSNVPIDPEAFRQLGAANHLGDTFATEAIGESEYTVTYRSDGTPLVLSRPVTVPDGHYFLIGDNRANSWDSRYPEFGCVPRSRILGRAIGEGREYPAARDEHPQQGVASSGFGG